MSTENPAALSEAEQAAAAAASMTPAEYAHYKDPHAGIWQDPARAEHERLKQAVREALDERDAAA